MHAPPSNSPSKIPISKPPKQVVAGPKPAPRSRRVAMADSADAQSSSYVAVEVVVKNNPGDWDVPEDKGGYAADISPPHEDEIWTTKADDEPTQFVGSSSEDFHPEEYDPSSYVDADGKRVKIMPKAPEIKPIKVTPRSKAPAEISEKTEAPEVIAVDLEEVEQPETQPIPVSKKKPVRVGAKVEKPEGVNLGIEEDFLDPEWVSPLKSHSLILNGEPRDQFVKISRDAANEVIQEGLKLESNYQVVMNTFMSLMSDKRRVLEKLNERFSTYSVRAKELRGLLCLFWNYVQTNATKPEYQFVNTGEVLLHQLADDKAMLNWILQQRGQDSYDE
jgi:hypothetical protein